MSAVSAVSTRERLLATALDVFAERGTDGGSMREIAKRAGVNVATAYHHFGSKRDMLLAIFRELGFLDRPPTEIEFPADKTPAARLELIIFGSWMVMDGGRAVVKVMVAEALKGDDDVLSVFDAWRDQGDDALRSSLLRAGLADERTVEHRAWAVRQVVWATFVETLMRRAPDWDELHRRAQGVAAALIDGWL